MTQSCCSLFRMHVVCVCVGGECLQIPPNLHAPAPAPAHAPPCCWTEGVLSSFLDSLTQTRAAAVYAQEGAGQLLITALSHLLSSLGPLGRPRGHQDRLVLSLLLKSLCQLCSLQGQAARSSKECGSAAPRLVTLACSFMDGLDQQLPQQDAEEEEQGLFELCLEGAGLLTANSSAPVRSLLSQLLPRLHSQMCKPEASVLQAVPAGLHCLLWLVGSAGECKEAVRMRFPLPAVGALAVQLASALPDSSSSWNSLRMQVGGQCMHGGLLPRRMDPNNNNNLLIYMPYTSDIPVLVYNNIMMIR